MRIKRTPKYAFSEGSDGDWDTASLLKRKSSLALQERGFETPWVRDPNRCCLSQSLKLQTSSSARGRTLVSPRLAYRETYGVPISADMY